MYKEKKDYLIQLLQNFDEKFDGNLKFEYENKECSSKEFLENIINKEMPLWLDNNSNDFDWTILLKGFNECFKELLENWENNINLFDLGKIYMTREIKYSLNYGELEYEYLKRLMNLHKKNISDVCKNDKESNLEDIKSKEGRVLNKYVSTDNNDDIFIITDLSNIKNITTILFCNEY